MKNKAETPAPETVDETAARLNQQSKGRATPTRAQQQAANRRPLVSDNKQEQRAKMRAEREKQRVGMMNGDPRYLGPRDAGEQRKFTRDYVDSRISVSEMLVPLMVVFIIASLFLPLELQGIVLIALWAFFGVVLIEAVFTWFVLGRRLKTKFGYAQRGFRFYSLMRMVQMRFLRLPKPQVKVGTKLD